MLAMLSGLAAAMAGERAALASAAIMMKVRMGLALYSSGLIIRPAIVLRGFIVIVLSSYSVFIRSSLLGRELSLPMLLLNASHFFAFFNAGNFDRLAARLHRIPDRLKPKPRRMAVDANGLAIGPAIPKITTILMLELVPEQSDGRELITRYAGPRH